MNYYQDQFLFLAYLLLFVLFCAAEGFISISIGNPFETVRKYLKDRFRRHRDKDREPLEQESIVLEIEHKRLVNEDFRTEVAQKRLDLIERLESSGRSIEAILPPMQTSGSPGRRDLGKRALPAAERRSLPSVP